MADLSLVLLGAPGAGKGTQAKPLAKDRGLLYVSTGGVLRAAAGRGSASGRAARRYMDAGELVPDDLVYSLVLETLEQASGAEGVLFDGFPRTITQAEALDETLRRLARRPPRAVLMDVPDEVLVARLSGRRGCVDRGHEYHVLYRPPRRPDTCDVDGSALVRRSDDEPQVTRRRLTVYHEQTEPLIDHYAQRHRLLRIAGEDDPEEVRRRI